MVIIYGMRTMIKDKRIFLLIILLALGWGVAVYLYINYVKADDFYGNIYHRQAPRFTLTGHGGSQVRLDQFQDKIVLISWGYTNCPDICPLTLADLKETLDLLGEDAKNVQVLFITVDPERDTPERLSSYVPYFDQRFLGLTGTDEQISEVAENYSVTVVKHPAVYGRGRFDTWDRYLMTHTNTIHLVDRDGRLFLTYPNYMRDPAKIASDVREILHDK